MGWPTSTRCAPRWVGPRAHGVPPDGLAYKNTACLRPIRALSRFRVEFGFDPHLNSPHNAGQPEFGFDPHLNSPHNAGQPSPCELEVQSTPQLNTQHRPAPPCRLEVRSAPQPNTQHRPAPPCELEVQSAPQPNTQRRPAPTVSSSGSIRTPTRHTTPATSARGQRSSSSEHTRKCAERPPAEGERKRSGVA
jgi:hypothetical protein